MSTPSADSSARAPGRSEGAAGWDEAARLRRLLSVSLALGSEPDLQRLLGVILSAATDVLACGGASVLLYDAPTGRLRFAAATGADPAELARVAVPLEGSVAGDTFTQNRPVVIADARGHARHDRRVGEAVGVETRALVSVPLAVAGRPIGVLQVLNPHDGAFAADALDVLDVLAAQAAVALERAQQRHALEQAHADLAELDRMKSDFLAIASHELRTPLAAIVGYADILCAEAEGTVLEFAEEVAAAAAQAHRVIESMTHMSAMGMANTPIDPVALVLQPVVQASVREIEPLLLARQQHLALDLGTAPIRILADPDQLRIALAAVLDNATGFAGTGGRVSVRVEAGGMAEVVVSDSGPGIAPAERERIFKPFYQVGETGTREREGPGLGLSLARLVLNRHGGHLRVDPAGTGEGTGGGATFRLSLPLGTPTRPTPA